MPSMTPKMDFRFQSTRCYYGRWDSPGMCRHPNHRDREWWSIKNKAFLIMCRSAPLPERTRCPSIQTWARLKMRNSRTSRPQCILECAVLIQAKSCTHVVKSLLLFGDCRCCKANVAFELWRQIETLELLRSPRLVCQIPAFKCALLLEMIGLSDTSRALLYWAIGGSDRQTDKHVCVELSFVMVLQMCQLHMASLHMMKRTETAAA